MKTQPMNCETCFYSLKVDSTLLGRSSTDHLCRRYPPTVQMIPQPNPVSGQIEMATAATFAPIKSDQWCGEYKPKV